MGGRFAYRQCEAAFGCCGATDGEAAAVRVRGEGSRPRQDGGVGGCGTKDVSGNCGVGTLDGLWVTWRQTERLCADGI